MRWKPRFRKKAASRKTSLAFRQTIAPSRRCFAGSCTSADAVVHIVGFRFGAEPNQRPVDASRRSYTQMEFDIARAMETPVYVFLSTGTSVRETRKQEEKPEDDEAVALQLAHRDAFRRPTTFIYFFKDKAESVQSRRANTAGAGRRTSKPTSRASSNTPRRNSSGATTNSKFSTTPVVKGPPGRIRGRTC